MSKSTKIALTIVVVVLTLGAGTTFVAAANDEPEPEEIAFIEVLDKYLSLAQRVVNILYQETGMTDKALAELDQIITENTR